MLPIGLAPLSFWLVKFTTAQQPAVPSNLLTSQQSTLLFLMDHLRLVSSQSQCNKMTPQNVAVCFAPVLMLHSEIGRTEVDFHRPISILKYLLTIWPTKTGNLLDASTEIHLHLVY